MSGAETFAPSPDPALWNDVTPGIRWPDDRAWCVATEVDLGGNYVGGSRDGVAGLLADPALEALPAELDHRVTFYADRIGPRPGDD